MTSSSIMVAGYCRVCSCFLLELSSCINRMANYFTKKKHESKGGHISCPARCELLVQFIRLLFILSKHTVKIQFLLSRCMEQKLNITFLRFIEEYTNLGFNYVSHVVR